MSIDTPHRLMRLASARYRQHSAKLLGIRIQSDHQIATVSQLQNHSRTYILLSVIQAYRIKALVNMHMNYAQSDVGTG